MQDEQTDFSTARIEQPSAPLAPFPVKHNPFKRFLHWVRHDRGGHYFLIALAVALATGGGLIYYMNSQPLPEVPAATVTPKPQPKEPPKYYSPLTGVQVPDEALTKRPVTAIMIENSPDARPQSGLKDAGIVFEAVAEGGITRFNALYQEARPGLIGPVRSVRPYYVEWAAAYDPAVAHIGGSHRALQMVRGGGYGVDLDQFFNAGTYWRASDRYAPHNVYTSFDKLDALNAAKGKTSSTFTAWERQDGKKSEAPNATSIDIDVSSGSYAVHYDYDAASNTYIRKQGGVPHTDREAGQIQPSVAIAIKVPMSLGFEDGNREQITTTGSGEGYVFQNGTVTAVTWAKTDAKAPITFTGADGKPLVLNRGQTWITALANTRGVSWQ